MRTLAGKPNNGRNARGGRAAASPEADALKIPLPGIVVRVARVAQGSDGQLNPLDPPILYPHRPAKTEAGRDHQVSIVRALSRALSVYSHVTVRLLQFRGKTLLHAEPIVERVAGRSLKGLLKISATALSELTAFDNNNDVATWAAAPNNLFLLVGADGNRTIEELSERGLDALRLISAGLARAERVIKAIHSTQLSPNNEISAALAEAFRAGVSLHAVDCFKLAMVADINASPLWRAHSHYVHVFELARFIGRVDRGGLAVLPAHHIGPMDRVLEAIPEDASADSAVMQRMVREAIGFHFGVERFRCALQRARSTNGLIAVDRKTRRLRCRTDAGFMARIFGRHPTWK